LESDRLVTIGGKYWKVNQIENNKYHTVGQIPKYNKYHTVGQIPNTTNTTLSVRIPKYNKYHTAGTDSVVFVVFWNLTDSRVFVVFWNLTDSVVFVVFRNLTDHCR
jgi:hypothetical protein